MPVISLTVAQSNELAEVELLYKMAGYNGGTSARDVTVIARKDGRLVAAVRLCNEGGFKVLRGMHVHRDFQQQGIGSALLSHCAAYLEGSYAYCLPYTHLVGFYEQVKFAVAEKHELPPLLVDRLAAYVSEGQSVLAMKRLPFG